MSDIHISLVAEPLFHIGSFAVTNSILTSVIGTAVITAIFYVAASRAKLHPQGAFAHTIESVIEAILDLIEQVTHNRAKALAFFPLLMTLFSFIIINNWLGLLPGVGTIVTHTAEGSVPLFRAATADLNTTFALGIISVVMGQIYAIKELGLFRHLKKYFSWNPVFLFVGLLEIVSEFSRMISFSFRLFGNIFAGEVLLAVIAYLLPLMAPLPFFVLEIFVGFIQALVFTMLSLVFLEIATSSHDDHASEEHASHVSDETKIEAATI